MTLPAGRYAPSPSGDLHLGNLRTALIAWASARSSGRNFLLRVEDIDEQRSSAGSAQRQIEDLAALGLDWDGPILYQQDRYAAYEAALARLPHYECYCSRRDIREATRAPHQRPDDYPGTCRDLPEEVRERRRAELRAQHRHPAIRLRAEHHQEHIHDLLHGEVCGPVDDMVLRRGGQEPGWAYNLAVVVDDAFQGIDQVVRGDDLLDSAPRQTYLARMLGVQPPREYIHVPLVLNPRGARLAKRDGAVTLRELDLSIPEVILLLTESLGFSGIDSVQALPEIFDAARLPRSPWVFAGVGTPHSSSRE